MNENLWACLDDPRPAVRRATYALVSACCRHAPGLLRPPAPAPAGNNTAVDAAEAGAEVASSGGDGVGVKSTVSGKEGAGGHRSGRSRVAPTPLLVGLLSEKDESNHREAWQAALLVLREFRQTWAAEKGATVS